MTLGRLMCSLAAVAVLAMTGPASADSQYDVPITIQNHSDAWAWITIYSRAGKGIMKSGCVDPKTDRTFVVNTFTGAHGSPLTFPYEVRAEITHKGCTPPVYADRTLGWSRNIPYYVRGKDGQYSFWHAP